MVVHICSSSMCCRLKLVHRRFKSFLKGSGILLKTPCSNEAFKIQPKTTTLVSGQPTIFQLIIPWVLFSKQRPLSSDGTPGTGTPTSESWEIISPKEALFPPTFSTSVLRSSWQVESESQAAFTRTLVTNRDF